MREIERYLAERKKVSRGPTIDDATTPSGINRKTADRMVDPQGYFHPKRLAEKSVADMRGWIDTSDD